MNSDMDEFLQILEGTEKSKGTIDQYRRGLEQYSDWLEQEALSHEQVSPRDVQRYLSYLKAEFDYAPKTVRLRFTAISQFYRDLTNNGAKIDDPTDPVRIADFAPMVTRREEVTKEKHIWMSKDEVKQIVDNVPPPRLRNRLIVLFHYFTGLRRQEVVDVRIADLDREERRVQVRGKGAKIHSAHWQPRLDGLLTTWLNAGYRDASPYARNSPYLFVTESTPQMSPGHVNRIVRKAAKEAGIQEVLYVDANGNNHHKYTSHTLRHSFAMHYLQNGGSIESLSNLLAHSSVTTTEIYGEILEDRAKDEYERYAPDIEYSSDWST